MKTSIVIAGAAGFVGQALTAKLKTEYAVIALSRQAREQEGVEWRSCDLFSLLDAEKALQGADTAFYLVHSMLPSARLTQGSFEDFDLIAADNFARAARSQGVRRIIYLGGLLPTHRPLSRHLASRLEVERTLANSGVPVTTLRAGLVVGAKGSSFQMLVRLVRRLPAMVCPKWTESLTQPIALQDVVALLAYCLEHPETGDQVYDVGGPDVLSYREMIAVTATEMKLRRKLFRFPLFTPGLSRLWVTLVTGAPRALVLPLVQSLRHDMVAHDRRLQEMAQIPGRRFRDSLRESLAQAETHPSSPRAYRPADPDPDVRSVQRLPRPAGRDALWMAHEYYRWLPRFLPKILRVTVGEGGIATFALPIWRAPLLVLQFAPERSRCDRALFYLRGGALAKLGGRGRLEFRDVFDGKSTLSALHEFRPRLPWYIYKWTQAPVHWLVMKAFALHLRKIAAEDNLDPSKE